MVDIRQSDKKDVRLSVRIPAALAVELRNLAQAQDVSTARMTRAVMLAGVKALRDMRASLQA